MRGGCGGGERARGKHHIRPRGAEGGHAPGVEIQSQLSEVDDVRADMP